MAKQCGISWVVTEEIIRRFLDKCDGLSAEDKKLRLNNSKPLFGYADYHFSCRTFKETFGAGYCKFSKCVMCELLKAPSIVDTLDDEDERLYENTANEILAQYPIISMRDNPKEMYYYENGVYKSGAEPIIRAEAQRILDAATCKRIIEEVIYYIQNITFVDREDINPDPFIINLQNGLYNVKTETLEPHRPDFLSTCQLYVKYDPAARCPEISNFLCEILRPKDIALILQEGGYLLIPDYTIQKVPLWNGGGLNGKGTLGRLFVAMVGAENKTSKSLQALMNDRFAIADLFGKLLNIDTDLPGTAITDDSQFKKLTGGDPITGQHKFGHPFDFFNKARLIFGANDLPEHPKGGYAWERRWMITDFPCRFEKTEDNDLDSKLQTPEELSGFLNMLLKALHWLLKTKRYFYDKKPEEVGEEYLLKSNSALAFMVECTSPSMCSTETTELYNAYFSWAKAKGVKRILAVNMFGKKLSAAGYEHSRGYFNGVQRPCYEGVTIDAAKIDKIKEKGTLLGTLLNQKENAYTHWYLKDSEISRVSRVYSHCSSGEIILNLCIEHGIEVTNEKLIELYKTTVGMNPTYPTQTDDSKPETGVPPPKEPQVGFKEGNPTKPDGDRKTVTESCGLCGNPLNGQETCYAGGLGLGSVHVACEKTPWKGKILKDIPRFVCMVSGMHLSFKAGDTAEIAAIQAVSLIIGKAAVKVRDEAPKSDKWPWETLTAEQEAALNEKLKKIARPG